ncbi:nickel/cobalt ABC transporter permease [Aneurinibacillus migulanus]|jgi:nickel transport system permease protein|uniref:Nickel transport system permease protein n=1 Tax=Aneurinibacillus migulanus TaxID=47500 RepID=A0A0D1XU77_ANEMI|nr:nickel/cobalt ABC transporter permease [Aneurinibacillus migulanus]KIV50642.1 nickel transporter permease NikB [Aneurinibacillus migulanus]KON97453.1 nickel transporter permease NikB [Aneurinibacillus migulanus]MED0896122.1 ABC transporter permease [Aneurinibacillus migulanus]MED1618550.1 ABC transporter permease [Aneurinibacillus migulanus]SDK50251.1 nickel transport system permease protein [Aneurinibacillus migulanus]
MGSFIIKRVLVSIPLLLIISFLTFVLINLSPLDPAEVVLHAQGVPKITDELIAQTKAELGMDRPFLIRYINWFMACLQLDFGKSYVTGEPVWSLLGPAFLNTLKLTLVSVIFIIALSILLGVICALKEGKMMDKSVRGISFFLTSMPSYWLAALMIWYFSVKLDLLPTSGMDSYKSYILPVIVIVLSYAGIYFRIVRSSMVSNLNEDYVLYGRACGLPEKKITMHILRNSLQVAISVFCMAIPIILGSTVVVENVFAWPGLGSLSVKSILSRDFPMIQAYVLVLAVAFVLFNTISDIINAAMNPKLRKDL